MLGIVAVSMGADKKFTLVLDAGHGGKDSGCKGTYLQEKDINLRATLMLGELIKSGCPDVSIIYTRSTDVFIPLHQRADIANKAKADLFISIHTNSGPHSATARGFETWTMGMRRSDEKLSAAKRENDVILIEQDYEEHYAGYDPNSPESNIMFEFMLEKNMDKSVELARYIQNRVCGTYGRANRGVRQDVFLVLRETSMPACLIELGFITNAEEQDLMAQDSTLAPTMQGIYEAFLQYKNKYDVDGTTMKVTTTPTTSHPKTTPSAKAPDATPAKPSEPVKEQAIVGTTEKTIMPTTPKTSGKKNVADKPEASDKSKTSTTEKAKTSEKPKTTERAQTTSKGDASSTIIYKVQILAVNRSLRSDSEQFKGHSDVESYREGNTVKYTIGSSTDYDEMAKLRRKLQSDFPEAFVVAFKNGEKMSANDALKEQKQKK